MCSTCPATKTRPPRRKSPSAQAKRRSKMTSSMLLSPARAEHGPPPAAGCVGGKARYTPVKTAPRRTAAQIGPAGPYRRRCPQRSPFVREISSTGGVEEAGQPANSTAPPAAAQAQARWKQKCGRAGAKTRSRPASDALRCGSWRCPPLHAAAAAVEESRQIPDLRLPAPRLRSTVCLWRRPPPAVKSRWPHAGEAEGDLGPVQAGGGCRSSLPGPAGCSCAPIFAKPARCRSTGRPRIYTRRAATSPPGPAAPAAARRTGWRPAFVPLFAPEECCRRGVPETHNIASCQLIFRSCARGQGQAASTSESRGTPPQPDGLCTANLLRSVSSTLFFAAGCARFPVRVVLLSPRSVLARCAISAAPIPQKIPQTMQNHRSVSPGGGSLEFGRKFVWFLRAEPLRLAYARQLSS